MDAIFEFVKQYGGLGWVIAILALLFNVSKFLYELHSKKVALKVKFSNGMLTFPDGKMSDMMIFLEAANTGNKKVVLSSVALDAKNITNGRLLNGYGNLYPMPYALEPGHNYRVWYDARTIAKSLKRQGHSGNILIYGSFDTQANGSFKSKKPYKLDIDSWSK